MACTLIKARAADYRKETKEYVVKEATTVANYTYHAPAYDILLFISPANQVVFEKKSHYVQPANEPKPENTKLNGVLNDKREKERICIGLNL